MILVEAWNDTRFWHEKVRLIIVRSFIYIENWLFHEALAALKLAIASETYSNKMEGKMRENGALKFFNKGNFDKAISIYAFYWLPMKNSNENAFGVSI